MSKKVLFVALAALGLSSTAALASVNSTSSNPNVYVGLQAGYGDTNWSDTDVAYNQNTQFGLKSKDGVFAGRIFTGYNFNQYLAVEGGYTYFGNTKTTLTVPATVASNNANILPLTSGTVDGTITTKTYGLDLVGRINVPVTDGFGLYAKAGPGYLHSSLSGMGASTTSKNVDLVFGGGADYQIGQNLVADVSFTRFNGNHNLSDFSKLASGKSGGYQPNADLYAVGLAYKFNV